MSRFRAAVVGLGHWGPNLARNVQLSDSYELVGLCDLDRKRVEQVGASYPWTQRFVDVDAMLAEAKPDLVAVCTPVASHASVVRRAIDAGAHVLCEKPLAASGAQAEEIVAFAERRGRRLFVNHMFANTSAVRCVAEHYASGASGGFGELLHVDCVRINLGRFQPDVDVIWDLAPHDLSILSHVVGRRVASVQASGTSHNPRGIVDVAYLDVAFEGGVTAHLHLSWLSPIKVRRMILSGTRSSIVYDDLEEREKIRIYDQSATFDARREPLVVHYRRGDMQAPALEASEPLATALRDIATVLGGGEAPVGTGDEGLAIVRVLEASHRSLRENGARITL